MKKDLNEELISYITSRYDKASSEYDQMIDDMEYKIPEWFNTKLAEIKLEPNWSVLELGCGPGNLGKIIKDHQKKLSLTGVDISPGMLEIAKKLKIYDHLLTKNLNTRMPELKNNKYDVVVALGFLELICNIKQFLEEVSRVLVPNGLAFFSIETHEGSELSKSYQNRSGFYNYTHSENYFRKLLDNFGFHLEKISKITPYILPDDNKGEAPDNICWILAICKLKDKKRRPH